MRSVLAAVLVALALALPASADVSAGRVTVFAASSLTEVFRQIDPDARYEFGGSDQLAFQIRQGAPADVYAAASPKYPQQLYRAGLVERPVAFATNELILMVPASNPAKIHSVFDLRRPGIKLVIGQKGVPIGDYTRKVLQNLGLAGVIANVISEETEVKSIVGKIVLGQADAGFVYRTDAKPVARKVRVVTLPAQVQPRVQYDIAVVRSSKIAAARAFVKHVLGKSGRMRLTAAGFGLP